MREWMKERMKEEITCEETGAQMDNGRMSRWKYLHTGIEGMNQGIN